MTASISFGSKRIDFHVEYSNRKTLGIIVLPNMDVLIKAPADSSLEQIKAKIKKKATWIIRQQSFFYTFHPKTPARKFIAGETHLYLGRQYLLRIILGSAESVKLKGRFMEVITPDKSNVKQLVNNWYLFQAKIKFHDIAQPIIKKFRTYNVEPVSLFIREMPTRWGSCTPKGKIILNPELIKAPKGCIEYVIIHELCHLICHDHTKKFIDLLSKEMADWEKWKLQLEKLLA
ncbi:MAG: M48 family metallopeptidase [Bacteroidales bacterium]|nr:M48 family metallopeptidase [Bacteroidales bacterium]